MATCRLVAAFAAFVLVAALGTACDVDSECPGGCNAVGVCVEGECSLTETGVADLCCEWDEDCPVQECSAAVCTEGGTCLYFVKEGCEEATVSAPSASASYAFSLASSASTATISSYDAAYTSFTAGYSSSSGGEGSYYAPPTARNGCIYAGDTRIACVSLAAYDCSSTWGFKLWVPVSDSITHMILADAVDLSVLGSSFQNCYRLGTSSCYSCLYLSDVQYDYSDTYVSVEAHVQFTSQCDSNPGVYFLDFGRVQGGGLPCGQEGYEYLPCVVESPYTVTPAPDLWDVVDGYDLDRSLETSLQYGDRSRSSSSDTIELIGTCAYYVHHSSRVLINCFSVTFDTCGHNAHLVSTAGMDLQLPFMVSAHEQSVLGCLPASDGSMACTRVSNIVIEELSLSMRLYMSVAQGDNILAGQDLGTFVYYFPECGHRTTCGSESNGSSNGGSSSNNNNNNNNNNNGGGTTGGSPGGNTGGNYGNYDADSPGSSSGMSTFWVVFLSVMAVGITVIVIVAAAVAIYLKKRRDSYSDPDTAYQLMMM